MRTDNFAYILLLIFPSVSRISAQTGNEKLDFGALLPGDPAAGHTVYRGQVNLSTLTSPTLGWKIIGNCLMAKLSWVKKTASFKTAITILLNWSKDQVIYSLSGFPVIPTGKKAHSSDDHVYLGQKFWSRWDIVLCLMWPHFCFHIWHETNHCMWR